MPAIGPCPSLCLRACAALSLLLTPRWVRLRARMHSQDMLFKPASFCPAALTPTRAQIMPPFDPEMVQPMQDKLEAEGVELCLGDSVKGFSAQQVMPGPG